MRFWSGLVSLIHEQNPEKLEERKLTVSPVIVLIAAEILVAAINIVVDVWAGGEA